MQRGTWQLWVGLAFSLGFLALALRDVRLSDVGDALRQVNVWLLLLALAVAVATNVAKAARWQFLLAVRKSPSLGRAFSILSIGLMVNAFMPARLGELVRAYLMGEAEADSKMFALGTIAVEKITDVVFLVLAVALLLSQMALPEWLTAPAQVLALAMTAIVPLFLLLAWQSGRALQALERVAHLIPVDWREWVLRQARSGLASLAVLRQPRLLAGLLIWSLGVWLLSAATIYLVLWTMGLSLSIWASLLLLVVLQAGVAVPSSPGRIGVFHYLVILTLSLLGVGKDVALGYGVVLHLVIYVPIALFGAWYLWREQITWRKLTEAAGRLRESVRETR
jgi:glycosyltransferase 2 family protein